MPSTFTHPERSAAEVVAALGAAGFEAGRPARRTITVLDTFDGRLRHAGLRLELHDGTDREVVLRGEPGTPPARMATSTAPAWPDELPAGPLRNRLGAVTQERAILPVFTLTSSVLSLRHIDRRGKATVQVDLHTDLAVEGTAPGGVPGWVAEVIEVAGYRDAYELTVTQLAMLGLDHQPEELVEVVAAASGHSLAGHSSAPTVGMTPDEDALVAVRRVLRNLALTIQANLPGTIADTDPEFLHELRVAVRRTRSVLSQINEVLPPELRAEYLEVFRNVGQLTGPPRDLDVYVLGWGDSVAALGAADALALEPVRAELAAQRTAAKKALAKALQSRPIRAALDRWLAWLLEPDLAADEPRAIGPIVARRISKAQSKLLGDGREITAESEPERLHDLRKDAKKLRYLLECFGGLLDPKPRKAFVSHLKALQENLGDHQDTEVQVDQLRGMAHELHGRREFGPEVLMAVGRMTEHIDQRRRHERAVFAERFASYDTKANRKLLDQLLTPVRDA